MDFFNIAKKQFMTDYQLKEMTKNDIEEMYLLCRENTLYYKYCPPFVTKESLLIDLEKLPPNKTSKDKYFLGIYEGNTLVGLIDIILKYPNNQTAFIGFFMMNKLYQSKGIGSQIIQELCIYLKEQGFDKVRLGYVKGNLQSEGFWLKNNFKPVGLEIEQEEYCVVVLERNLTDLLGDKKL